MFFKKKKETIKIEMYAPVGQLIDMFPPTLLKNTLPSWWKTIDTKNTDAKTVKHCPGFVDLYKYGIAVPLWSDYQIDFDEKDIVNIQWPTKSQQIGGSSHLLAKQAPNAWPGYTNVKFSSPWRFWCAERVPFMAVQPVWSQQNPHQFITIPGILDFNFNHQANVNTLWKPGTRSEFLKAGTIITHLVPLTQRPLEISYHVMTSDIFSKKFAIWDAHLGIAQWTRSKFVVTKNGESSSIEYE